MYNPDCSLPASQAKLFNLFRMFPGKFYYHFFGKTDSIINHINITGRNPFSNGKFILLQCYSSISVNFTEVSVEQ